MWSIVCGKSEREGGEEGKSGGPTFLGGDSYRWGEAGGANWLDAVRGRSPKMDANGHVGGREGESGVPFISLKKGKGAGE